MRGFGIAVFLLIFIASLSYAQERKGVENLLDQIEKRGQVYSEEEAIAGLEISYDFEMGSEYTSFSYEEPPINIEDEGDFYGVFGVLTRRSKSDCLISRVEGRFAYGRVDYDGSLSNGTPHTDEGDDYTAEIRGLLGRDFQRADSTITPFVGFGYRYLNDQLESIYAYEREITYLYSPVGFETSTPLGQDWTWGVRAEYDIFWSGVVKSHLSDVDASLNDLRNEQDNGYGVRGSVYLKKKINEKFQLSIEPFFRYWEIEDSNLALITVSGTVVSAGYEPANRTKEYGLKVSLIW
ncbi:MAG: hypothetical protein KJ593_07670 [Candidatus Omnitrophica bacterium]|nr:hypothetical protein [Candidatus Omnitrophota bacterium]